MKHLLYAVFLFSVLYACVYKIPDDDIPIAGKKVSLLLDTVQASRLATLPMNCLDQEFPNKLNQVLANAKELRNPKSLHPAFYGCFDWHSAVHGQWLLIRLMKEFPEMEQKNIREKLSLLLTKENIEVEMAYFDMRFNPSFERTYGWAWILKLHGELLTWNDSLGRQFAQTLKPLAQKMVLSYVEFLPKLSHPLRSGEHINTAFGLSLAYDYAKLTKDKKFMQLIVNNAKKFFLKDEDANMSYEPSGYDFLSPILEEAYLMTKVLPKAEFLKWLSYYMPSLFNSRFNLEPLVVTDRKDGKLVHLDGLNLSRSWCLYAIAKLDKRLTHLRKVADNHLKASLPTLVDGNYMGEHWLASFALNALLERKGLY
jgi:hypothetical protein